MTGTARHPAFLSSLDAPGASQARPAAFAVQGSNGNHPRSTLGPRPPPPPPGPTEEQLAALRAAALQQVAGAVEELRRAAAQLAELARVDALDLGFLVARRVIGAELSTSPDAFVALVRSALQRAGDSRKVTVRLHPLDAKEIAPVLAEGGLGLVATAIEVVLEPSLSRGDCVVDTDFGKVDGRIQTRLDELHRAAAAAEEGSP